MTARYPHNAERLYYRLLRTAIEQWFAELKEKLFQHPAIRKDELFDNIFDQQQGRWADFSEAIKNRMGDVSGQVSDTVQRTFAEQAQQVQNDLGIDLSRGGILPFGENQAAVNAFTRENTLLIKDIVSRGASTKELQKLIQENLGSTKKRAALIARDQIGKLNGQLTRIQHEEAGIENYEWSTSNDSRVRSEHAKREGKVFSYKKPPPDGNPGSPIRCRCVALPVFDDAAPEQAEELPVRPEAEKASGKPKASSGGGSVPPKPPRPPVSSGGANESGGNEGGSPPISPRRRGAQPPTGGGDDDSNSPGKEPSKYSRTWNNPPENKMGLKDRIEKKAGSKVGGYEFEYIFGKRYFDLIEDGLYRFPADREAKEKAGEVDFKLKIFFIELTVGKPSKKGPQIDKLKYERVNPDQLPVVIISIYENHVSRNERLAIAKKDGILVLLSSTLDNLNLNDLDREIEDLING